MYPQVIKPVREDAPCKGCTRAEKTYGCHDRCEAYRKWKQGVETVNERRREYSKKPFSKIL